MNLDRNPTRDQLRQLIAGCDDAAGHHILWVAKSGEVRLSRIPKENYPVEFEQAPGDVQMQVEPFLAGNEYVGPEAAADDDWIDELYVRLTDEWCRAKGSASVAYLESL